MTDTPPGALPLPIVPGLTDLEVFARGGYATVYRAIQNSVGREVAVKVENRTLDSERDQQRFLREARAAGRMSSHPHVVDLFDAGVTHDRHPYLIMELCDGSYAERMRTSPLGAAEARDVGVKIADALADAHQLGVLHRDVKPANILYSRFNEALLADFGLAILAEARDSAVTMEVLTPAYAPPEMFGHHAPSEAVDVYALCATLYAIMNGKPPRWQADRNPSLITLMELFNQPIPDLPGIPHALVEVLRKGMANDPAARPSAVRLRDMLAEVSVDESASWPTPPYPATPKARQAHPPGGRPNVATYGTHPTVPHPGRSDGLAGSEAATGPVPPRAPVDESPRDTQPAAPSTIRRRLSWLFGGFGAVALLTAVSLGSWYVGGHGLPGPSPTEAVSTTASLTPSSSRVGGILPGCLLPLPDGGRCPEELECYDPVRVARSTVKADRVPCAGRHTWESYAVGDLPTEVVTVDHETVKGNSTVRRICGESSFRRVTLLMSTADWRFEVLPPSQGAVETGDRTFRCLAGKGANQLSGPTLAR